MIVAICDDEQNYRKVTRDEVLRIGKAMGCHMDIREYTNGNKLLEEVKTQQIDVVLLDIDMPDLSGMEIANELMKQFTFLNIIFVTNKEELVFQSLRYRPLRFVRKSKMVEELEEALMAAKEKLESETFVVAFGKDKTKGTYKIRDIWYMESDMHYIIIHTTQGKEKVRGKISECEKCLKDYGFIRTHVGYLVNVRYIAFFESDRVVLDNGESVPVSRRKAEMIRIQYAQAIGRFINGYRI